MAASPGDAVYPTPAELRAIGTWVESVDMVTGLPYTDPDDEYDLLGGGIPTMSVTEPSLRENHQLKDDAEINLRVAPISEADCKSYANWPFEVLNLSHRANVSIYGPEPAHTHESWVGSQGATTPTAAGVFTADASGDDPPKLTLEIASGYETRLDDIPSQDFPVGMPGAPNMYWTRKADEFRAYDGDAGADTGNPYSVPAEGVYSWLGWAWLKLPFVAPAACRLTVTLTSRRYRFGDNHFSDSSRQEDFTWMSLEDEEHTYRISMDAGSNIGYVCLPTPIATEVDAATWAPAGDYPFGSLFVYEGVPCEGECDLFTQRFFEQIFGAIFVPGWYTKNLQEMIDQRPTGSSYVENAAGILPVPGDILIVIDPVLAPDGSAVVHAGIVDEIDLDGDIHLANSNAFEDELGYFSRMEYYSENLYRWWPFGKGVLWFRLGGDDDCNGLFYDMGNTYGGKVLYEHDSGKVCWYSAAATRWVISDTPGDVEADWYYMMPVGGDEYSLPLEVGTKGTAPAPEAPWMFIDGWFHWDDDLPQPVHPVLERVVSIAISGFATGAWQLTDAPRLIADPVESNVFGLSIKAFEGHDPLYNKGGLSARVDCAHLCTMYCGDMFNSNYRELTIPFFDYVVGAVSGLDMTSAHSISTIAGLITKCCDAWTSTEDTTTIEAHTKDEDDNQLAMWGFDICYPIDGGTIYPLEPIENGNKLMGSLRARYWTAVGGIEYMVIPDWVGEGRAQGLDLYAVGSLARSRTGIGQMWYRSGSGTWTKWATTISSDQYGLWRSKSLPMIDEYEWNADYEEWFPVYWEWAATYSGVSYPASNNVIGLAPHRETVSHFIVYREPGNGSMHIAFNAVANTLLVTETQLTGTVGIHKMQIPLAAEYVDGLKWSERFPVEDTTDIKWANIAIVPSRAWHSLVLGDDESYEIRPGLHLEEQGGELITPEEEVACPMALSSPIAGLLHIVGYRASDGIAVMMRKDTDDNFVQFNDEELKEIGAAQAGVPPALAAHPLTWMLAAAVQANDATAVYMSKDQGTTWEALSDAYLMRYPALWATDTELWLCGWSDVPVGGAEGSILLQKFEFSGYDLTPVGETITVGAGDEGRPGIIVHPTLQRPIVLGSKTSIWDADGPDVAIVEYISMDSGATWQRRGFIEVE